MSHEHATTSRTLEVTPSPDFELAGSLQAVLKNIETRDFSLDIQQSEALEAIGHALIDGTLSGYIEMATSTGKTTVEALVAEAAVHAGKRVLLLAPTIPIAKQIEGSDPSHPTGIARFAHLPKDTSVRSHFGTKRANASADIVISTYAGFVNDAKNGHEKLGEFDVIIADECHRSLGKETSEFLKTTMPNAFKLGLSATPDYAIDRKSDEVYSRCLYEFSLLDAVEAGKTAPVRTFLYETDDSITLNDPQREFTNRELAPLTRNMQRNGTAVALAQAFVEEGRQGIIACVPGDANLHARLMADLLKKSGIRAMDIGAHLDADTIARRLALYQKGGVDILTFTRALEEGWDSQQASFAINLAPTSSPVRTTQLLGRILRKKPSDLDSIFVDFVDQKSGNRDKTQFTALHALGLEDIDITRVLGRTSGKSSWDNHSLKLLQSISPKVYERLLKNQGMLLSEVAVGETIDPLVQEWERILAKEELPAELHHNDALPPALSKRVTKAYQKFYRDNGVEPSVEELIEYIGKVTGPEREILGSYALRSELSTLEDIDRAEIPDGSETVNPDAVLSDIHLEILIELVLDTLSEREAGVVMRRFGMTEDGGAKSFDEIAKDFGVTSQRIRQIESKTMSKLRLPSRSQVLKDFLYDDTGKDTPLGNPYVPSPSRNLFIRQFKDFTPQEPLPDLDLSMHLLPATVKAQSPWLTDDSSKNVFHWESVIAARNRYGITDPTHQEFSQRESQLVEAIEITHRAIARLEDLPIAEHESSLDQRLATLDVYQKRLSYLETMKDQLEQLHLFLESQHALVEYI